MSNLNSFRKLNKSAADTLEHASWENLGNAALIMKSVSSNGFFGASPFRNQSEIEDALRSHFAPASRLHL